MICKTIIVNLEQKKTRGFSMKREILAQSRSIAIPTTYVLGQ